MNHEDKIIQEPPLETRFVPAQIKICVEDIYQLAPRTNISKMALMTAKTRLYVQIKWNGAENSLYFKVTSPLL